MWRSLFCLHPKVKNMSNILHSAFISFLYQHNCKNVWLVMKSISRLVVKEDVLMWFWRCGSWIETFWNVLWVLNGAALVRDEAVVGVWISRKYCYTIRAKYARILFPKYATNDLICSSNTYAVHLSVGYPIRASRLDPSFCH